MRGRYSAAPRTPVLCPSKPYNHSFVHSFILSLTQHSHGSISLSAQVLGWITEGGGMFEAPKTEHPQLGSSSSG